jgi:hypothetical protein
VASDPRVLAASLLAVSSPDALAALLARCVELPGIVALELHDGTRPLFTALRQPQPDESFPRLVRARVPLPGSPPSSVGVVGPGGTRSVGVVGPGGTQAVGVASLAVHLVEPGSDADEAGLRLIERLAPTLREILDQLGWPLLQDPVLPLQDRAHPAATMALHLARTLTGRHKRSQLSSI